MLTRVSLTSQKTIYNFKLVVGNTTKHIIATFSASGSSYFNVTLTAVHHHGLRGSASPVLTATGDGNFRPPTEPTPLDRSPKNLLLVITLATPTAVPNLVQIRPRGASGQMGEI